MTGIGFLGAGTIIQVKDRCEGLTTAAGIWAVAAVGMAFGSGLYVLAIGATVVLLVTIAVIGRAASRDRPRRRAGSLSGSLAGQTRLRRRAPRACRPCR